MFVIYGASQLNQVGTKGFGFNFVDNARAVIRDFDHDGHQDFLVTGYEALGDYGPIGMIARLYHNDYPGTRPPPSPVNTYMRGVETIIPPIGFFSAGAFLSDFIGDFSISAGDLDGDGFADVYVYGSVDAGSTLLMRWGIYRNDGEVGFTLVDSGSITNASSNEYGGAASVWADFNGDGRDDLLTADGDLFNARVFIRLNDGQGHLVQTNWALPQLSMPSVAAGDIFNHGRNDIVISGIIPNQGVNFTQVLVLRNDGGGVFTPIDFGLYPVSSKQGQGIALADYDKDGRLDVAIIGNILSPTSIIDGLAVDTATSIYRNELDIPTNHPPTAPGGLATVVGPGTVTFSWGTATDDITPTNMLTYNLRVGTNTLGTSTVSPLANVTNGWRKIAAPGNAGHCFKTLYRFPPGTYYWSVQAVDGIFAGGAWATEQTFTITDPERPVLDIARATTNQHALKWSTRLNDFTLQQKPSLTASNWTAVTNTPLVTNGKQTVNVTNAPAAGFFRLSKP